MSYFCKLILNIILIFANGYYFTSADREFDLPDEDIEYNEIMPSSLTTKSPRVIDIYETTLSSKTVTLSTQANSFEVPKSTNLLSPSRTSKSIQETSILETFKRRIATSRQNLGTVSSRIRPTKSTSKFRAIPIPSRFLSRDTDTEQTYSTDDIPTTEFTTETKTSTIHESTTEKPVDAVAEYPFVVPFIYKRKFPPAPICSGSIITEILILTAAYPIAVMPRGLYCALPGYGDLKTATTENVEKYCIGIKKVYLDTNWQPPDPPQLVPLNLAVVELDRIVQFTWSVSTGRVPFNVQMDGFLYDGAKCFLPAWKYRRAIAGPGFPLEEIAIHLISQSGIVSKSNGDYFISSEEGKSYLCAANIGMPIICNCSIVGIIIPPEGETGYFPCNEAEKVRFLPILTDEAQHLLDVTIPSSFIARHYDDDDENLEHIGL